MASAIQQLRRILPALLLIVVVASCNNYEVSENQADSFVKFYGSYQQDEGVDVRLDSDGGYVIAGTWTDPDSARQVCLIKTDELGNEADWSPKLFGYGFDDVARDLKVLDDGYLIVGTTTDADDSLDILLIRTDKQGNLKTGFPRVIDLGGNDEAMAVDISLDTTYTIVGYSDGLTDGKGGNDGFFFQTNTDGIRISVIRAIGSDREDVITDIVRIADGFFVIGNSNSYLPRTSFDNFPVLLNLTGGFIGGGFGYGDNQRNETDQHIELVNSDEAIVSATSTNQAGTNSQIYLSRINLSNLSDRSNISVTSPGSGSFSGQSVLVAPDGNYVLVGTVTQNDANIFALGLGTDGSQMFYTTFGRTGEQSAGRFRITPDGGLIIVGSNGFESNAMVTLIKTGPEGSMDN